MVKKDNFLEQYKYPVIVIGTSILSVIILGLVVGRPLYSNLSKTSKEVTQKKETLTALETKLETLKGLKEKEAELKEKNQKVLAALPQDKDIARLFVQFEKVAQASGLTISQVTEQKQQSQGQANLVQEIHYQVNASASNYPALKDSLAKLSDALRILSVSNVSLTKNNNALGVILDVVTYKRGTN